MLLVAITAASARIVPSLADRLVAIVDTSNVGDNSQQQIVPLEQLHRVRRQSAYSNDYLANYYNDYYNNYYNGNGGAPAPKPSSADRFDDDDSNALDNKQDNGFDSSKYVYTPLFQYKATHQKHHKLFVPNLFG